ncbi:hypothetical protein L3V83_14545 [Thiotrichales bacterium 19X7-9]|nr:hypothetical protein [Thiotrichales bacterium 19X7-9]
MDGNEMKYFKLTPVDSNDPKFKATSSYDQEVLVQATDEDHAREIAERKFAIYYGSPALSNGVWKNDKYVVANELHIEDYLRASLKTKFI